jgi:uncharacterized protein (DUF305 family)
MTISSSSFSRYNLLCLLAVVGCLLPAFAFSHQSSVPFDVEFLDTMSQHHREGIMMMEMAIEKTDNKKIGTDAQKMMGDQQREIQAMQALKEEIMPGRPNSVNMKMPGMMAMDMEILKEKTGRDFDRAYLKHMIKHHQGAIKMSDHALQKAKNAEVRAMAQRMHDQQKREIADMKSTLQGMK